MASWQFLDTMCLGNIQLAFPINLFKALKSPYLCCLQGIKERGVSCYSKEKQ